MTALDAPCRLPVPRPGQVLGLVGTNGIGKSTALKVRGGAAASEEEGGERASTQGREVLRCTGVPHALCFPSSHPSSVPQSLFHIHVSTCTLYSSHTLCFTSSSPLSCLHVQVLAGKLKPNLGRFEVGPGGMKMGSCRGMGCVHGM